MRLGYYDLEGNLVYYDGGDQAYDMDSRTWMPIDIIEAIGVYVGGAVEEFKRGVENED